MLFLLQIYRFEIIIYSQGIVLLSNFNLSSYLLAVTGEFLSIRNHFTEITFAQVLRNVLLTKQPVVSFETHI